MQVCLSLPACQPAWPPLRLPACLPTCLFASPAFASTWLSPTAAHLLSSLLAAPEQLLGERCTLSADIYSFGLILSELTTQTCLERRGVVRLPHAPTDCSQVRRCSAWTG